MVCLTACDHESSIVRKPWSTWGGGLLRHGQKRSRKMRWAEHVARIGDRRGDAYRDLVMIFEGKRALGIFRHTCIVCVICLVCFVASFKLSAG